ncbi:uncharacterized protein LOC127277367 [Leptopilina boulardi]|uniref:uncharacterized protein LOC127277367 n=1 Tax=Leptopilina boulardi TaxID=63433 RepID=UPI0021F5D85B|nr:uncharacterized protein LOC127277367 [Leptopilina boulardi]
MKYTIFFAGVVLFQLMSIALCDHKKLVLECAKELGITEAMLKLGHDKNLSNPKFRCFDACLMKKDGSLEPGNKVNHEKLLSHAKQFYGDKFDAVIKALIECDKAQKAIADECDYINAIYACVVKKVPNIPDYFDV